MSNPFSAGGAQPDKASRFAPLTVRRFFSGQYSNSNPLSEPTVPYLYERFYSGSRYETIRYGSNVEISPRLTIIRRPGLTVYNSQTFPACTTFESFRVYDPITQTIQIRVIADTATAVYDATGPSTKQLIWTKVPSAGQTSFLSVGNVLYAADGQSAWKWLWFPSWQANHTYTTGDVILDTAENLQKLTAVALQPGAASIVFTINNNVASIRFGSSSWTAAQLADLPGTQIALSGFTTGTYFNGTTQIVSAVLNSHGSCTIQFAFSHANVGNTTESAAVVAATSGSGVSGGSQPGWNNVIGGTTGEGQIQWTNVGPAVQQWGINAPLQAPTVSNVFIPSGAAWVASTYYWPTPLIFDANSNIQLLTTDGTTAGSPPSFSSTPGATTADNTATWTCQGPAARATTSAYNIGDFIGVTVSTTTTVKIPVTDAGGRQTSFVFESFTTSNFYFYTCSVAGTSSSTATASITWPSNLGGSVGDGTVTWVNCGYQVTRTNVGTSTSPSSNTKGTVGNSQKVTQVNSIVDNSGSGGGTGFTQNVAVAGPSDSAHPTWATSGGVEVAGLSTRETPGVVWINGGPYGAANTGTWIYGYSFANSITGHESSMSPATPPILLSANSGISVSGDGDPNWATDGVDTINIYRSVQGFSTPFRLVSIPAPSQGAPWSYLDVSPDPPNPASILNEFISADTTGNNAPPPAGLTNLTFYLNRIFGSSGTDQFYSGVANQPVGVGPESWPGLNFMGMPEVVTRSWPSAAGLLIFTHYGVFFSQGIDSNGNPNTPGKILEDVGLLSTNCFTVNGSIPVLLAADGQMLALDPSSGVSRYNDPIADVANGMGVFSTSASYLTWHVNGFDTAFYLANGSTTWFRLCPTAAPESGFTWSPAALIQGGVGAIASIETSPGVKNLLIGPVTSGPILKRDLSVNTDNGALYFAQFVIGSLVLAQPNQCAEIDSISTYCTSTGSEIVVAVLPDEIVSVVGAPFDGLFNRVPEPPYLADPITVKASRWYMCTADTPAWMQHLQIQFSWPIENAANEILGFSIYGCVHQMSP